MNGFISSGLFGCITFHDLVWYLYGPIDQINQKSSPFHNVEPEEDTKNNDHNGFIAQWSETKEGSQRCGEDWKGESRFFIKLVETNMYLLPMSSDIDHIKQSTYQILTASDIDHYEL